MSTRLNRREFVGLGAAGLAGLALGGARGQAPANGTPRRPNVLFLHADQVHLESLSGHGCAVSRTPNLDRLIAGGVTFHQSYSANPVCCPARTAWFTGRATCETGVVNNEQEILPGLPDLGQWLGARGYTTAYAGKWHIPGQDVAKSFQVLSGATGLGIYSDEPTSRAGQGFLRSYRGDKPFFLSLGFVQPHDVCTWISKHRGGLEELPFPELADELPPLPANFEYDPKEPELFVRLFRREKRDSHGWSELMWRYYLWSYHRHVEMVDAEVGRVLDALEASPHRDNTVVLFSADHGEGRASHQTVLKSFLYDEAAKVPLVLYAPNRFGAGVHDREHVVSGLDMTPTICELAGVQTPPKARGRSLVPLAEGKSVAWREFVVSESRILGRMVRTPEWKLITYQGSPTAQLFDMRGDPGETKNLIDDAPHADVVKDLRARLADWEKHLEPVPLKGKVPERWLPEDEA